MQRTALIISFLIAVVSWAAFWPRSGRFNTKDSTFRDRYGKWAIVAGASEGLGAAWADALCSYGINVLLVARRETALKELATELESKYKGIQVDILVQDLMADNLREVFAEEVLQNKERHYGMLVYNAAHAKMGRFLDHTLEEEYRSVDLNVRGVVTLSHLFGNYLKQERRTGGIILMSSITGEIGSGFITNYAATKAWNTKFAHGLRYELNPIGIDVMACIAGPTNTPNYVKSVTQETRNTALEQSPQQVVEECVQSLGSRSSVVTGFSNKLIVMLMTKILPQEAALYFFSSASEKRIEY